MRDSALKAVLLALMALWPYIPASAQVQPMQPNLDGDYLPDPTQETPLSEAELEAAFSGMTHRGTYNFRRPNIDTFAFEETTNADGRTVHRHGDKV
ncbi:MAG: hypothetical protein WBA35_01635, partial [Litorimonas sp.]